MIKMLRNLNFLLSNKSNYHNIMKTLTDEQIRPVITKYLFEPNSVLNRENMGNEILKLYENDEIVLKDITTQRQVDAGTCYFAATDGKTIHTILIMPEGIIIK